MSQEQEPGLYFRLSQGKPIIGEIIERIPVAEATSLADAEADSLLERLKPFPAQEDDVASFAFQENSLPPPRIGQTLETAFPPPLTEENVPFVELGPLTVSRVQPEGEVPLADRISITFSQPMVPVTSTSQTASYIPVQLTPEVPGTWRWISTQTLVLEPGSGKRLPMATRYRVTIPAGINSAMGGRLAETRIFSFETPPVLLLNSLPNNSEPQPPDLLIWLAFDQRVSPVAILQTITLSGSGESFPIRLATDIEVASESATKWQNLLTDAHAFAIKPIAPLPLETTFTVKIGPDTPSLEGPLLTNSEQHIDFSTYERFRFVEIDIHNFKLLEFNNPIDEEAFAPETVQITPEVPDAGVTVYERNRLLIYGSFVAQTVYTVIVPGTLPDIFGQTLETPVSQTFEEAADTPFVESLPAFQVCDPAIPPCCVIRSVNTPSIVVKFYAVSESDWEAWLIYCKRKWSEKGTPPGRFLYKETILLNTELNIWKNTYIPLDKTLPNGHGNVIMEWISTIPRAGNPEPYPDATWLQATKIGLSTHKDATDLYVWVTDLESGKPIPNASVQLIGSEQTIMTTADGLAQIALTSHPSRQLVVRHGEDTAFLPTYQNYPSTWQSEKQSDEERWFIFDDRGLYRPGETAHFKGWLRIQQAGKTGELVLPIGMGLVSWTLTDSTGNEVCSGKARVNAWAGFDIAADLPKTMNLGPAFLFVKSIQYTKGIKHLLQVQEFRRPEFEVSARNESAGPHIVGDIEGADLSVTAKYYAGGALSHTPVTWKVTASPMLYFPPDWEDIRLDKAYPCGTPEQRMLTCILTCLTVTIKNIIRLLQGKQAQMVGISFIWIWTKCFQQGPIC